MSDEDNLSLKIQRCLSDEIRPSEMELVCSILRAYLEVGKVDLEVIGDSPLKMYKVLTSRQIISKKDHSKLIVVLKKANLFETAEELKQMIEEHDKSERPNSLSVNGRTKRAAAGFAADIAIKRSTSSSSSGSFAWTDGVFSPAMPTNPMAQTSMAPTRRLTVTKEGRQYNFGENCKGLVAIINNFTEGDPSLIRRGTIEDEERVIDLFSSDSFKQFYEVDPPKRDRNHTEFLQDLREWAQKLKAEENKFNSFLLFIMSHGDQHGIKTFYKDSTQDGQHHNIPIEKITTIFGSCLKGCPKVFIIQACQGLQNNVEADCVLPRSSQSNEDVESDGAMEVGPPVDADMLTAIATVKGYKSYRNIEGSWFINHLVNELKKTHQPNQYPSHLLDILTEVQFQVAARKGTSQSDSPTNGKPVIVSQIPCFQSSLRKKLYLLPQEPQHMQ